MDIFLTLLFIAGIVLIGYMSYLFIKSFYYLGKQGKRLNLQLKAIKQDQKAREEEKRRQEEKVRQEEEVKKKNPEAWKRRVKKLKMQEEQARLQINDIFLQLIHEIELCADERPCPKCNELDVYIMSLSPKARSLLARCHHCQYEYRIRMEPDRPEVINDLYISFANIMFSTHKHGVFVPMPYWQMDIKKRLGTNLREPIPIDVKKAVWKRDGGKCVNCGSDWELQYDHIIPVSKGGSSTVQNIQILCKKCNLRKHARIQ